MIKRKLGFAAMTPAKRKAIAAMGGKAIPAEKRSFSVSRDLAVSAGRLGGISVPAEKRSFSRDRDLARQAGRKGGLASHQPK